MPQRVNNTVNDLSVVLDHFKIKQAKAGWLHSFLSFLPKTSKLQSAAIADHITSTGHSIKWDHFEILATGRSDIHCRIKESLLTKDLKPSLNENVGSEKLFLY